MTPTKKAVGSKPFPTKKVIGWGPATGIRMFNASRNLKTQLKAASSNKRAALRPAYIAPLKTAKERAADPVLALPEPKRVDPTKFRVNKPADTAGVKKKDRDPMNLVKEGFSKRLAKVVRGDAPFKLPPKVTKREGQRDWRRDLTRF